MYCCVCFVYVLIYKKNYALFMSNLNSVVELCAPCILVFVLEFLSCITAQLHIVMSKLAVEKIIDLKIKATEK